MQKCSEIASGDKFRSKILEAPPPLPIIEQMSVMAESSTTCLPRLHDWLVQILQLQNCIVFRIIKTYFPTFIFSSNTCFAK